MQIGRTDKKESTRQEKQNKRVEMQKLFEERETKECAEAEGKDYDENVGDEVFSDNSHYDSDFEVNERYKKKETQSTKVPTNQNRDSVVNFVSEVER